MASLFDDLPATGIRQTAHGGALVTTANGGGERALQWVHDDDTTNCMSCNTPFTILTRKHHCRRCGNVICANCSPHKRRILASDPFPMRVCNTCYAAVDEHFSSLEWSDHSGSESTSSKPDPVVEGRVHIGQLYVKVVEAIGLPSTDSITSDPFVRVILSGKWSHGQEWGPDLKKVKCTNKKSRTLNPRWHETFIFNVCAPGAELTLQVYNHGQLSQPTKLGEVSIPLTELMDQRRHNKWLDLMLPEKLHRMGWNNDARAGRLHILLHYKFSRVAEFCSHYAREQEYLYDWPEFQVAQLYSNFWVLLDDLWPYLEVVWAILPTLNWEQPSHTFICFIVCIWLCLSIQWLPVILHVGLLAFALRNYFEMNVQSFSTAVGSTPASVAPTSNDGSGFSYYNLPSGFNHLMNRMTHVTIDQETKRTLQSVQNNLAWWSSIFTNLEVMFSWEDPYYTAKVVLLLIVSCVLHIIVPNKYLLVALVVYLFIQWTVPFLWFRHFLRAVKASIRSVLVQHRLSSGASDRTPIRQTSSSAGKRKADSASGRRPMGNGSLRTHKSVQRREEMIGAAASALSERFDESTGTVEQKKSR